MTDQQYYEAFSRLCATLAEKNELDAELFREIYDGKIKPIVRNSFSEVSSNFNSIDLEDAYQDLFIKLWTRCVGAYFTNGKYCVFFSPSLFDDETRRLELHYDIVEKKGFIPIPASASGRFGRCFLDCYHYKIHDVETAKKSMRNLLFRWASETGESPANVEVKNYRVDKDNPEFCCADYEFR